MDETIYKIRLYLMIIRKEEKPTPSPLKASQLELKHEKGRLSKVTGPGNCHPLTPPKPKPKQGSVVHSCTSPNGLDLNVAVDQCDGKPCEKLNSPEGYPPRFPQRSSQRLNSHKRSKRHRQQKKKASNVRPHRMF